MVTVKGRQGFCVGVAAAAVVVGRCKPSGGYTESDAVVVEGSGGDIAFGLLQVVMSTTDNGKEEGRGDDSMGEGARRRGRGHKWAREERASIIGLETEEVDKVGGRVVRKRRRL